jgi:HEAT repeat protein
MVKKRLAVHLLMLAYLLSTWGQYVQADPNATETRAYQDAYNCILEENWEKGLMAFKNFTEQYEKSPYFDDALFWHCFALEKTGADCEDVFKCYQDFIKTHPKSKWADDAKRNLIAVGKKLSEMGKKEYGAIIRTMQDSVNKEIALTAISALRNIGNERALEALVSLYNKTQHRAVREEIIFAVSQFKSPKVLQGLKKIVKEDPDRHMREKALFWLSQKTQSKEVIQLMEHVAINDPNQEVREKAVFALSQIRKGKGIGALKRIAGTTKDAAVRKEAVFWIGQNARSADVIQFLEAVVKNDSDPQVRERALHALAHQAPENLGVPALINLVKTHSDKTVRKKAVFWIGQKAKSEQAIRCLETVALKDTVAEIRKTALLALSQAPDGRGVEALKKIGGTAKDAATRKQAVFWLGQRARSADVIQFLETVALKDTVAEIRKTALLALSQAPDGRGVEALKKIGGTANDAATRKDAVFWIGQQAKSDDVIQFLENVVREDSDPEVRKHALTALVHAPQKLGVPALISLAKSHPDNAIRREAIFWLGESKDPRAMEALVGIVNELK